jgi:hypothetical protein
LILQESGRSNIVINALLDTGASKNYISKKFVESSLGDLIESCSFKVKSAFQEVSTCDAFVKLRISFIEEGGNELIKDTTFYLIDTSLPMIIGKEDIRSWNLPHRFPSLFFDQDVARAILAGNRGCASEAGKNCIEKEKEVVQKIGRAHV